MEIGIKNIIGVNVRGKKVLFRPDINSPIDRQGKLVNDNRLIKTVPTLKYLLEGGARLAIIAHQGDTLDYQNLIPLQVHAQRLTGLLGIKIDYIDDVCGDAAIDRIKSLRDGEAVILGNLRYLTEEVSTFEKDVKLTPDAMEKTYLVRRLRNLFDIYVNDAFSAAHRNSPSMTAFQRLMPSYAGPLFFKEYEALFKVMHGAEKPVVFVLGGSKISDAFGMMDKVLSENKADYILTSGVTGIIMHIANGVKIGETYEKWLSDRDLLTFVAPAAELLRNYGNKFILPDDLAFMEDDERREIMVSRLPNDNGMFLDIGAKTVEKFKKYIASAKTIFVNGPPGVYENPMFEYGTKCLWETLAKAKGYTVIGGGDTVSAASKYIDLNEIDYVCTAGGAMVRFLSGKTLPLIDAMLNN